MNLQYKNTYIWPSSTKNDGSMNSRTDLLFLLGVTVFFLPFLISKGLFEAYYQFNLEHGLLMSFIKDGVFFLLN